MANERVLKALLRFSFDRNTADQVERGVISIEDALESLEQQASVANDAMMQLTDGTQILSLAGQELSGIGQAIVGPLQSAATSYVQFAGRAEGTSRRWLRSTEDLERAQFKVGRAAAQAILPTMEKAADLAGKAAAFVEDHPGIVQAALQIGTVVAGLGAIGMAVTRGIRLYTDVKAGIMAAKQLLAATIMKRAADKQLAAAGVGSVGAGLGGGIAGAAGFAAKALPYVAVTAAAVYIAGKGAEQIVKHLGPALYGEKQWEPQAQAIKERGGLTVATETIRKTAASVFALGGVIADKLGWATVEGKQRVADLAVKIAGVGRAADKAADEAEDAANAMDSVNIGEAVNAFVQFQTERAESERMLERERNLTIEQFGRERVRMEEDNEFQRNRTIRDFHRQQREDLINWEYQRSRAVEEFAKEETQTEKDYYEDRAIRARDFNREMASMEEDHRDQMIRMIEDYEFEMEGLARDRDAIGYLRTMRQHEKDRRQAEQDHQKTVRRRNADYALELEDTEEQYRKQRDMRLAEFEYSRKQEEIEFERQQKNSQKHHNLMLIDMDNDFKREMQRTNEQNRLELQRMDEQFRYEAQRRDTAFADQLRQLDASLLGEREVRDRYYALMAEDLESWLSETRASFMPGYSSYSPSTSYQTPTGRQGDSFTIDMSEWNVAPGVNEAALKDAAYRAAYRAFTEVMNAQTSRDR